MDYFDECKIRKVCPGKLSKYLTLDKTPSSSEIVTAPPSTLYVNVSHVTARFKFFIQTVKISKVCLKYIQDHLQGDVFLTLRWTIFDIEDFVTCPSKLDHKRVVNFNFPSKYSLEIDHGFINKIQNNTVVIKLSVVNKSLEYNLAEASFDFGSLLEEVNTKQYIKVFFLSNITKMANHPVAHTSLWYKFSCKLQALKHFFPTSRTETKNLEKVKLLGPHFSGRSNNFNNIHVTDSELDHFADSVWLVLNRNKVLKTTQSDINNQLQERVRWLHFEANWKQTLQENAILHGKNPEKVIWRQWREEDTTNVRLRTYNDATPTKYKKKLTITVKDMYLVDGTTLVRNEQIQKLYVEYSFLGHKGMDMEAPISVRKRGPGERMVFNFKKVFPIHLKKNSENCRKLAEMIMNDVQLRFKLISEPVENEETPIQTCQEVGYFEVPLNELIQLQRNEDTYEYEMIDLHNPIVVLGYAKVTIKGILAMRKMALDLMAPPGYKLYA